MTGHSTADIALFAEEIKRKSCIQCRLDSLSTHRATFINQNRNRHARIRHRRVVHTEIAKVVQCKASGIKTLTTEKAGERHIGHIILFLQIRCNLSCHDFRQSLNFLCRPFVQLLSFRSYFADASDKCTHIPVDCAEIGIVHLSLQTGVEVFIYKVDCLFSGNFLFNDSKCRHQSFIINFFLDIIFFNVSLFSSHQLRIESKHVRVNRVFCTSLLCF